MHKQAERGALWRFTVDTMGNCSDWMVIVHWRVKFRPLALRLSEPSVLIFLFFLNRDTSPSHFVSQIGRWRIYAWLSEVRGRRRRYTSYRRLLFSSIRRHWQEKMEIKIDEALGLTHKSILFQIFSIFSISFPLCSIDIFHNLILMLIFLVFFLKFFNFFNFKIYLHMDGIAYILWCRSRFKMQAK